MRDNLEILRGASIMADALQVNTDIKTLVQTFYKALDEYCPGLTTDQKAGAFKVYCAGFMLGAQLGLEVKQEKETCATDGTSTAG